MNTISHEPAGDQDVWHIHTHVVPRYAGDRKDQGLFARADDRDRACYASRLRELLNR